jgi:hypothetical protein
MKSPSKKDSDSSQTIELRSNLSPKDGSNSPYKKQAIHKDAMKL